MKTIFLSLLLFLAAHFLQAQCSHSIDLEKQVLLSSAIFEGTVIKKESFWSEDKRTILTANYIEVLVKHKGEIPDVVKFITKGGTINETICVVTPSLQLEIGATGCFLTKLMMEQEDWFVSLAGNQSFLSFEQYVDLPIDFPIPLKLKSKELEPLNKSLPISITSISPMEVAAGIGQILTITGTGFGTFAPPAKVQFRNPNYFPPSISYQTADPDNIVTWTDTEIQIRVPGKDLATGKAGAASGELRVVNSAGEIVQSTQNITVLYNKVNHDFVEVDLVNDNQMGGYTLQFDNNFFNNSPAKAAFNRALKKWNCGTETNIEVNETNPSSVTCAALDGINNVSFDSDCNLPFGTLAETTLWFSFCGNGVTFIEEIDIVFASAINWNFEPGPTGNFEKDFESIALHELGHAHGVEHVLNSGTTMFPSLADGTQFRSIDDNSKTCTNLIIDHSSQAIDCGGQNPIVPTDICAFDVNIKVFLEGPYDGNETMTNELKEGNLLPLSHPYGADPYDFNEPFTVANIPSDAVDWIMVEARTGTANLAAPKGTVTEETLVGFLMTNGNIRSLDGTSPLSFRNFAPGEPYHFAIRHRNHLDIISNSPLSAAPTMTYDFTDNVASALGNQQQKLSLDGQAVMHSGDFNRDGIIQTTDYDLWADTPAAVNIYENPDANMDGVIQVTDYDLWFFNRAKVGNIELGF